MFDLITQLQSILDKIGIKSSSKVVSKPHLQNTSFVLLINCPEERIIECTRIVEAIGLQSSHIQIITDINLLPDSFQHIDDIVRL